MDVEALVDRWHGPIYGYARRIVGNDADAADLTQEVFLTIVRHRDRYDPSRPFEPWMWRVATNVVFRHLRDGKLRRTKEQEVGEMREEARPPVRGPAEDAEHAEQCRAVQRAIGTLSDEHRLLLVAHCVHGQSLGEIAVAAGLAKSTVQSRVQRALVALREALVAAPTAPALPEQDLEAFLATFPSVVPPAGLRDALVRATAGADAAEGVPSGPSAARRVPLLVATGLVVGLAAGFGISRTVAGASDGGGEPAARAAAVTPPTPAAPGLVRIVLAAKDPDACARFYAALLGMTFQAIPMGDLRFHDGRLGSLALRIFPASIAGIEAKDNRHQLGFRVEDLRAALARGLAAGGTQDAGWEVQSGAGGATVALRDPDGNSIELFEKR